MADAFDLDVFAPAPIRFKLRKREYRLGADPDVDVVAKMLRLETAIEEADSADETVTVVQEAKALLVERMLDFDPSQDLTAFKVSGPDVLLLFALIMHGSSVAAAVAEAITQSTPGGSDGEGGVITPRNDGDEEVREGDEAPLASAALSSERSSISDGSGAGLPATGSG